MKRMDADVLVDALRQKRRRDGVDLVRGTVVSTDPLQVEVDGGGTVFAVAVSKLPSVDDRVLVEFRSRQAFVIGVVGGFA